ncbi:surface protein Spb1 [Firmicutes bacterium CAG:83]|nr:surface protein Spb1 [Firmicutes bacterium CAG:83]
MKHTKKALALLMVLVMSLSLLTVTAFAAGTGKITIENATAGMEYKLYKVFDASYIDGTSGGTKPAGATYTIKDTDPWYPLVSASGSPFTLKEDPTHPGTYIVSIAEGQQETAATWFQNVDASGLAATQTKTPTNNTVTFDGLDKGYYYIKSGVGATVTLTHANEARTVIDKNQQPGWGTDPDDGTKPGGKFIKTGANGTGTEYGTLGTADIGGKLDYKIHICKLDYKIDIFSATNYQGDKMIKEYIIEDTESPAVFMHFSTIKVWVNGTELTKGWVEGVDETSGNSHAIGSSTTPATSKDDADWYVANADNTDSKFSIHINWLKSDGAFKFDNNGKPNVIKITYEGVLKSKGVVYGDNGNLNTATLFVLPNGSTTRAQVGNPSETKAVTYSGELFKYTTENGVKKPLAGAEFTIVREGETAPLAFYPSKAYAGVYYLANDENWNSEHVDHSDSSKKESMKVTTLVTPTDGMIITRGLAGGEYTITETKAPGGYNKLTASIKMPLEQGGNPTAGVNVTDVNKTLAADGSPLSTPVAFQNVHVKEIENNKGTVLPETGGIGTTLFITLGALAVIGTGLFLVTNKRISKENF